MLGRSCRSWWTTSERRQHQKACKRMVHDNSPSYSADRWTTGDEVSGEQCLGCPNLGRRNYPASCFGLHCVRSHVLRYVSSQKVRRAEAPRCPCSPLAHKKIDNRLMKVNNSVAEQTFAWFRNYMRKRSGPWHEPISSMSCITSTSITSWCGTTWNDSITRLSPFSSGRKRRHSRPYICRKPSSSNAVLRRPMGKFLRQKTRRPCHVQASGFAYVMCATSDAAGCDKFRQIR